MDYYASLVFWEVLTEDAVILTAGILIGVLVTTLIVVFGSRHQLGIKRGK